MNFERILTNFNDFNDFDDIEALFLHSLVYIHITYIEWIMLYFSYIVTSPLLRRGQRDVDCGVSARCSFGGHIQCTRKKYHGLSIHIQRNLRIQCIIQHFSISPEAHCCTEVSGMLNVGVGAMQFRQHAVHS